MSIFLDPKKAIEPLNIIPGMNVADIGCGSGYYTFAASEKMDNEGKIYAVDVRKNVLEKLAADAKEKGVSIVETIWGNAELEGGTKIADEFADAVIASNIFFQVDDKKALVKELFRITGPGGKLLVIDWSDSFGGLGPPQEYLVSPEEIKSICQSTSFYFVEEIKAGAHHYKLLFKKVQ